MKKYLVFSLIFFAKVALSQVNDSFEDGDFSSNPQWTGSNSTLNFIVANQQLRSNSTTASSNFYLSTANTLANECVWEFYCNLQFATSGSNYVDVYLISDQANLLASSINGYFVRIGNTSDEICLYKRSGPASTSVKIIDGADGIVSSSSNNRIKVKVSRTATSGFTLERDATATGNTYVTEGSSADVSFSASAAFGFVVQQSTASFFQKHFFDDISVRSIITDTEPPKLLSITLIDDRTIEVLFDEAMEKAGATDPLNYLLDNDYGHPVSVTGDAEGKRFTLQFASGFASAMYTLTAKDLYDKQNNKLSVNNAASFSYIKPYVAKPGDVVINEIFPDPSPTIGLPEAEYAELWNTSPESINLMNWKFKDGTSTSTLPALVLPPGEHLILCAKADTSEFKQYGKVVGLSPWPSLNNSGELLKLISAENIVIDSVDFKLSWYKNEEKKSGGWSLELINPNGTCKGIQNWVASTDASGGTPGKQNAVFQSQHSTDPLRLLSAVLVDSATVHLTFNRALDSLVSVHVANFSLNNGYGNPTAVKIVSPDFTRVELKYSGGLSRGKSYTLMVTNAADCGGILISQPNNAAGFHYIQPYVAKSGDMLINEIFADPSPKIDLPEAEFVELRNTSSERINLRNWKLKDGTSTATISDYTLSPNEYLILCAKADTSEFKQYGKVVGLSPWPSLNNSGELLKLISAENIVIDSVDFKLSWYKNEEKKSGGWSLELINPNGTCKGIQNWVASTDASGGTPGKQNSVYQSHISTEQLKLLSAVLADSATIRLKFNRTVDSLTSAGVSNFSLNNGYGSPTTVTILSPDFREAELKYTGGLSRGKSYMLTVTNIADCAGTLIGSDYNKASFHFREKIKKGDVLISELLFNPRPEGVDFLEIFNNTEQDIELSDLQIASVKADTISGIKPLSQAKVLMKPKSYLALTTDPENIKKEYPLADAANLFKVSSLPSFNDDKGTVVLLSGNSRIDQFSYSDKMHFPLIKNPEGVSLERTSFGLPADETGNFRSAAASVGYATPGYKNSQYIETGASDEGIALASKTFSPDNDGFEDALAISYKFSETGITGSVTVFNDKGNLVRKLVRNSTFASEGTIYWDGMDDSSSRAAVGIYIIYFDLFNLNGTSKRIKKTCVLATRL